LDIGVLGYIGIVQHKEHSPEVLSIPPGTPCICYCRSQWPRGLSRRSTAARLLRLWIRIPPGHGCLSVVRVVCCQVEVSATDWSLVQRSPTDCGALLCVITKPRKRGG